MQQREKVWVALSDAVAGFSYCRNNTFVFHRKGNETLLFTLCSCVEIRVGTVGRKLGERMKREYAEMVRPLCVEDTLPNQGLGCAGWARGGYGACARVPGRLCGPGW